MFIACSYIGYTYSLNHRLKELTTALKKNEYDSFKEICPKFTNKKSVTKVDYKRFRKSIKGNITIRKVRKIFLNRFSFKKINGKSWYKKKYFYPIPKYLIIDKSDQNSTSKIEVTVDNEILDNKNEKKFGPLIAGNYKVTYLVTNEKFGTTKISKNEKTYESHDFVLDDSYLYLHDSKFQNYLISQVSTFFSSMGSSISSNLNFDDLKGITDDQKKATIKSFGALKTYLESVSQSYQKIVLNNGSLKFSDNEKNKISFDIYTDYELKIKFKSEKDVPLGLSVNNKNATVALVFDSDTKHWLVENIDFETYAQNPEEWTDKTVLNLDQPSTSQWSTGNSGNIL